MQSSKTVPKSVNPNYNAQLQFGGVTTAVINRSSLHISVLGDFYHKSVMLTGEAD